MRTVINESKSLTNCLTQQHAVFMGSNFSPFLYWVYAEYHTNRLGLFLKLNRLASELFGLKFFVIVVSIGVSETFQN